MQRVLEQLGSLQQVIAHQNSSADHVPKEAITVLFDKCLAMIAVAPAAVLQAAAVEAQPAINGLEQDYMVQVRFVFCFWGLGVGGGGVRFHCRQLPIESTYYLNSLDAVLSQF